MCYNAYPLFRVILNVVKNLETQSGCIQILRDAQNDIWVRGTFDTLSFYTAGKLFPLILRYKSNAYTSVIPEM